MFTKHSSPDSSHGARIVASVRDAEEGSLHQNNAVFSAPLRAPREIITSKVLDIAVSWCSVTLKGAGPINAN
jgi:hypothetical protein